MEELLKSLEKDKSSRYLVGRQDWLELSVTFCHMENGGCFRVTAQNEWDTLNHVYKRTHTQINEIIIIIIFVTIYGWLLFPVLLIYNTTTSNYSFNPNKAR